MVFCLLFHFEKGKTIDSKYYMALFDIRRKEINKKHSHTQKKNCRECPLLKVNENME